MGVFGEYMSYAHAPQQAVALSWSLNTDNLQ